MVWVAISNRGISKPFFQKSGTALTKEIYSNKCVRKKLLPFIQSDNEYLFWPDLETCHYARYTMETFDELNINVVTKEFNPPSTPQLRPIEDFWGILKSDVYRHGWVASNHEQLKRRIQYCLDKMDLEVVCNMMNSVKQKLRKAKDFGVLSTVH